MKRNENIVPLSRDHHDGLLFCWKIRQGIKYGVSIERIQAYVKYFWDNHLEQHFEEEETLLFAGLQDKLVNQAVAEHGKLKRLIDVVVSPAAHPAQLITLANTLDDHIRFEERVLFPHLEKVLSGDRLADLGKQLQQIHHTNEKENYTDEFWVKAQL
ncbi:hemerythrin domain-containing protein [Flavihumibacter solisilvae]|uniref:Hemerythrin-like domain-containing protein n=1 Tax=Flavihumibacter solisilvae TaxID=1349421 RepID=A0A0C1IYC6_9BACT|nr:hemerythrin domain-containing protein [Flavihumibacter solisilvae]KIC95484.1 hypothetical protein OI18_06295 [Flavihumibacter solisilvae]